VFVTVRHTVTAAGEIAVVEEHDIVYREAAKSSLFPLSQTGEQEPGEAPQGRPAPRHAAWRRELVAGPAMLFRFSALIFNAHRIHYDLDYCRDEEHYPGLIVHGPLQTVLLLDLCRRHETRPVRRLDYRARLPVFHTERFTVNGNPRADGATADLWTANAAGDCAMEGTACFT
jgi:3-methylfumaryl-CoA hydratase